MGAKSVREVYNGKIGDMRLQGYTLQRIGDTVGVTRERIRQILGRHFKGIQPEGYCEAEAARLIGCSENMLADLRKRGILTPKRYGGWWLYDNSELDKARQAVVAQRQSHLLITVTCGQCGKEFPIRQSVYNTRLHRKNRKIPFLFCNRHCYGRYLGLHHGLGVHPEHSSHKLWAGSTKIKGAYRETECIGCGEPIPRTRRGIFCSTKCYRRLKSLYRYYSRKSILVTCFLCGTEVYRGEQRGVTRHRHFCDSCLVDYRRSVGERLARVKPTA